MYHENQNNPMDNKSNSKQLFFSRQKLVLENNEARKDSATMPQHSSTCADNKLDNANMLNNYFSKCFTTSLPPLCGSFESAELEAQCCELVTEKEVI